MQRNFLTDIQSPPSDQGTMLTPPGEIRTKFVTDHRIWCHWKYMKQYIWNQHHQVDTAYISFLLFLVFHKILYDSGDGVESFNLPPLSKQPCSVSIASEFSKMLRHPLRRGLRAQFGFGIFLCHVLRSIWKAILINPFILNNYREKCKMLIAYMHVTYKKTHTYI